MIDKKYLLTTAQMAEFVARGFLRFDELVPEAINRDVMAAFDAGGIDAAPAGTPLSHCYPQPSPIGAMLRIPKIQCIIHSLVGPDPLFDHHAIHVRQPNEGKAQGMHGDSIIDTRMHFDIQLMYFPHDVPLEMGGTLLVPGSQYRRINEADIARYQNFAGQVPMVCKAGSLLALHHGIWREAEQDRPQTLYVQNSTQPGGAPVPAVEHGRSSRHDWWAEAYLYNRTKCSGGCADDSGPG